MELEEALKAIGGYGKYQVLLWLLMAIMDSWTASWHMLVMTFVGYEPSHHCKVTASLKRNPSPWIIRVMLDLSQISDQFKN